MYPAYIALVVSFVLVIVLHAWCVRRLAYLYNRMQASRTQHTKIRTEAISLAKEVGELELGVDSNEVSIQALEREIEELEEKLKAGVPEEDAER